MYIIVIGITVKYGKGWLYRTGKCDASQWRRTWSKTTANGSTATQGFHSNISGILLRSFSRGRVPSFHFCSYVTLGFVVVDCTFCAYFIKCSFRNLTCHLFRFYISTVVCLFTDLCIFVGQYRLRAVGSNSLNERERVID